MALGYRICEQAPVSFIHSSDHTSTFGTKKARRKEKSEKEKEKRILTSQIHHSTEVFLSFPSTPVINPFVSLSDRQTLLEAMILHAKHTMAGTNACRGWGCPTPEGRKERRRKEEKTKTIMKTTGATAPGRTRYLFAHISIPRLVETRCCIAPVNQVS